MRLIILLFVNFVALHTSFAQENLVYFSDAIKSNIKKYNTKSDIEFEKGNIAEGQALFDSLVQNRLVGSRFDDYSFKSVNSRKVKLSKMGKPVFIITYASWCVMNKGEIPALNKLAKKYNKDLQIIVVFWDIKNDIKKISRQFNGNIKVCYANESYRNDAKVVATLKHTLGFPTCYFLNSELDVIDITRGSIPVSKKTPFKKAIEMNYVVFDARVVDLLAKKDAPVKEQQLATVD
ncbi:hypothetical protein FNO01nite_27270 [Flavobacterium noncentrifugens]|uniref:Thiol-disulfide isomerase or thioredoxin n=1 Tax=Flavobacterium noncentrifugens TaxID=1128970 RepID=A0A1G9CJ63_9FLAO|nr:redoxin domain-containing protein [Flavobacterium noncentrifugens]GEP52055.1 hypothetical protein FNO01nite_27270 [Flavobacterium noncentrifugens]SDK51723.1 Thiol-disulfide isomerase or thioredoxin [Flavobacterium noncentrifugens]